MLKYYRMISVSILLLGVVLMIYMINVESEPGALPLILILAGIVGFIVSQLKLKKIN